MAYESINYAGQHLHAMMILLACFELITSTTVNMMILFFGGKAISTLASKQQGSGPLCGILMTCSWSDP